MEKLGHDYHKKLPILNSRGVDIDTTQTAGLDARHTESL